LLPLSPRERGLGGEGSFARQKIDIDMPRLELKNYGTFVRE